MNPLEWIGRQALFALDPETAHGLSIAALKTGMPTVFSPPRSERLATRVAGLAFPNPLGMAAGYDKNGEVPDALLSLGFGFAEIGTVTPLPQAGNPRPRIFRLTADGAVINRLGFNNQGYEACHARMTRRAGRGGIVGVNIGANKDAADRMADYEAGVRRFAGVASYLTVNISSPNTPGLRAMQSRAALDELVRRVLAARGGAKPPIFVKVAPDLAEAELDDVAAVVLNTGVDGVIVSNTTISRPALASRTHAGETGGLSGRPLFERSTIVLAKLRQRLGPKVAMIGVGGVDSAETALEKMRAGADLVQLYTGMIYAGPSLPGRIVRGMARFAEREGLTRLAELRDSGIASWAAKPLPA